MNDQVNDVKDVIIEDYELVRFLGRRPFLRRQGEHYNGIISNEDYQLIRNNDVDCIVGKERREWLLAFMYGYRTAKEGRVCK